MDSSGSARSFISTAVVGVLALAGTWLVARLDLGLAFTVGLVVALAITFVTASAAAPAIRLTAATSEPADGWGEFHRELNRARRFDRPFGIVRFVGVDRGLTTERHLRDQVASLGRRIDRVWLDGGDLFVLMPESDASAVETAVARVRYRIGAALDDVVTATFPANGITSGSLIGCLYQGDTSPVAIGALSPVPSTVASLSTPEAEALAETAT
jgi:hypothetical protein